MRSTKNKEDHSSEWTEVHSKVFDRADIVRCRFYRRRFQAIKKSECKAYLGHGIDARCRGGRHTSNPPPAILRVFFRLHLARLCELNDSSRLVMIAMKSRSIGRGTTSSSIW